MTQSSESVSERLGEYRRQIAELREKIRQLQASVPPTAVEDYAFTTAQGTVRLSQLFGDKDTRSSFTTWVWAASTARCGPMASTVSCRTSRAGRPLSSPPMRRPRLRGA
jgi:predicted dithiol-disulfide oxidoreductase (DUF899 family)